MTDDRKKAIPDGEIRKKKNITRRRVRNERLKGHKTTYALFRNGIFITQAMPSVKKFLALAGVRV